jgi:hypothetical protein
MESLRDALGGHIDPAFAQRASGEQLKVLRAFLLEVRRLLPLAPKATNEVVVGIPHSADRVAGALSGAPGDEYSDIRRRVLNSLIYTDRLIVPYPVRIEPVGDPPVGPWIGKTLETLRILEPLISAGAIDLVSDGWDSHYKTVWHQIHTVPETVRDIFLTYPEVGRRFIAMHGRPADFSTVDSDDFKTMMTDDLGRQVLREVHNILEVQHWGVFYVPVSQFQVRVWDCLLSEAAKDLARHNLHLKVLTGLTDAQIPGVMQLHPSEAVELRNSEEHFTVWRSALRNAVRSVEATPFDGSFSSDISLAIEDMLVPIAADLRHQYGRSRFMRGISGNTLLNVSVGGITAALGAAAFGAPVIESATLAGLGALGAGLISSFLPEQPRGVAATLRFLNQVEQGRD